MGLVNSWTDPKSLGAAAASATFTVPIAVPVGALLVIGCVTGAAATLTATDSKSNTYTTHRNAAVGSTLTSSLIASKITTALAPGDTITVTRATGGTNQRFPAVFAYFNDAPANTAVKVLNGSEAAATSLSSSLGPTGAPNTTALRNLVLMVAGTTNAGAPWTGSVLGTLIGQAVSTVGSSDRSAALVYAYQGPGTHTMDAQRTALATWSAGLITINATDTDPSATITAKEWTGSVETTLTVKEWNGTSEVALTLTEAP